MGPRLAASRHRTTPPTRVSPRHGAAARDRPAGADGARLRPQRRAAARRARGCGYVLFFVPRGGRWSASWPRSSSRGSSRRARRRGGRGARASQSTPTAGARRRCSSASRSTPERRRRELVVETNRAALSWTTALPRRRPSVHVTTGLLDRVGDRELQAVLAHELAHVLHRDAVLVTLLAGPPAYLMAGLRSMASEGGREWFAAILFGVFLVPPAAVMLAIARVVSRHRELAADRAAAVLTGSPASVAAALLAVDDAPCGDAGPRPARGGGARRLPFRARAPASPAARAVGDAPVDGSPDRAHGALRARSRRERAQLLGVGDRVAAHRAVGLQLVGAHAPQRRRVGVDGHGGDVAGVADAVDVGGGEGEALARADQALGRRRAAGAGAPRAPRPRRRPPPLRTRRGRGSPCRGRPSSRSATP